MKAVLRLAQVLGLFLSDLCGREEACHCIIKMIRFLSDLCGREVKLKLNSLLSDWFLSDLCGREVISVHRSIEPLFLSDLCGREV